MYFYRMNLAKGFLHIPKDKDETTSCSMGGAGIPARVSYSSKLFLYFSNKEKTLN